MTGRYQRAIDLLELITLLQEGPTGFSIQQIADHFEVSRRTAERMLSALQRRFPELQHELRKGRKYWRFVPSGQTLGEWNGDVAEAGSPVDTAAETSPLRRQRWLTAGAQPRDALAGTIAEALRGPVSTIALIARSALEPTQGNPEQALARISKLAERTSQTIDRTLALVRRDALKLEPTNPGTLLQCAADEVRARAEAAGIEMQIVIASDLPSIVADRSYLASALADLAVNAIDAMPSGGQLSMRAELCADAETVRFSVEDDGSGIPEGDEEWIFEPFYTTKDEGTGLGLAMARQVAVEHGGTLKAMSRKGHGAVLRLEMPVSRETETKAAPDGE